MHTLEVIASLLTAVGTIAVAALAIWGDWFRAILAPAKLTIESHNLIGDLTVFNDPPGAVFTGSKRVYFYHLKVVNHRLWVQPKNCRVLLKSISKRGPDGDFHSIPMSVPFQFTWAPADSTPTVTNIKDEAIFDFGRLTEFNARFMPSLYSYPNNFLGIVGPNEAIRYSLQVVSDIYISSKYQVFEVAWDGVWDEHIDKMAIHLNIKEVTS